MSSASTAGDDGLDFPCSVEPSGAAHGCWVVARGCRHSRATTFTSEHRGAKSPALAVMSYCMRLWRRPLSSPRKSWHMTHICTS